MNKRIAIVGLVIILAFANWTIYQKEQHLVKGETVFLELAPVDPRSLMQGDYMALRYVASTQISQAIAKHGDDNKRFAIFEIDEQAVVRFRQLWDNSSKLSSAQRQIALNFEAGNLRFATDAFFFEEGSAQRYENARFGMFALDEQGQLLLLDLANEDLKPLSQ